MDPLSDVLKSVRLTGGVFLDAEFTEPWAVLSHLTPDDCRLFVEEPAQIIAFHVILEGNLIASIDNEPLVHANAGDIILIPRNEPHRLASSLEVKAVNSHALMFDTNASDMFRIRHGGGGAKARIVCGYLASEHGFNPVVDVLPRLLRVDTRTAASKDWIEASIRYAASGSADREFASSSVMARLSELLLIEAVRQYALTRTGSEIGWLKGVNDKQVGRALSLMHADLAAPWSAQTLAQEVAMSRSAFVERFTRLVGVPPIRYLTQWRLGVARHKLRESSKTVQQVAPSVGYTSEEAFSRAFKREFGLAPSEWRERAAETR